MRNSVPGLENKRSVAEWLHDHKICTSRARPEACYNRDDFGHSCKTYKQYKDIAHPSENGTNTFALDQNTINARQETFTMWVTNKRDMANTIQKPQIDCGWCRSSTSNMMFGRVPVARAHLPERGLIGAAEGASHQKKAFGTTPYTHSAFRRFINKLSPSTR